MDLYRYALVLVVGILGYLGLLHLYSGLSMRKSRRLVHLGFSAFSLPIALHDLLWLIRADTADLVLSHKLNIVQWGLTWIIAGAIVPAIDLFFKEKLGRLAKLNLVICGLGLLLSVFLPHGGMYKAMPQTYLYTFPWGESIYALDYRNLYTMVYYASLGYAVILPQFLIVHAWKYNLQTKKHGGWLLVIGTLFLSITLGHDIAVDLLGPDLLLPVRIQHFGTVLLALALNLVLFADLAMLDKAQQELLRQKRNTDLLLEHVPSALYQARVKADNSPELIWFSSRLTNLSGIAATDNFLRDFMGQLEPSVAQEFIREQITTTIEKRPFTYLLKYPHPDGNTHWFRFASLPLEVDNELHYFGVIVDQTESIRSEHERERLTQELQLRNEELEGMLYAASHDLRTPLVNILGFSSELKRDLEECSKNCDNARYANMSEDVEFIESNGRRMDGLLSSLLEVLRTGTLAMQHEKIDLYTLLHQLVDDSKPQWPKDATITIQSLPVCIADKVMLTQVIDNLLQNAIKYRDQTRALQLDVSAEAVEGKVILRIKDNGIGMDARHIPTLFKLFHRLDPRKEIPGHGIGLAVCYRLMRRMGGTITVSSVLGEGTEFTLELPGG